MSPQNILLRSQNKIPEGAGPDGPLAGCAAFCGLDAASRLYPSRCQFDYIVLSDLRRAIVRYAGRITGRVLDYGCGLKPYAELLERAAAYIGADFSQNLHADLQLDDSGVLPPAAVGFDPVVSFQVLEHVPDVGLYLSECGRVLERTGGALLLTTHGIWDYHPGPYDLYRWTHEGLAYTLQRFGFRAVAVEPITTGFRSLLQLLARRIERRRIRARWLRRLLYWMINVVADACREAPTAELRLADLPICYLYLGYYEGVART